MQALQAIEPAPDSSTVYFNDQVLCKNPAIPSVSATYASDQVVIQNGTSSLTLTEDGIVHYHPNTTFTLSTNYSMYIDSPSEIFIGNSGGGNSNIVVDDSGAIVHINSLGLSTMGDYYAAGNNTAIIIDEPNGQIDLNADVGSVNLNSSNAISLNAQPSGEITIFTGGDIRIGNIAGAGNQNELLINTTKMKTKTTNGFQLTDSTIQYPSTYRAISASLTTTSFYAQTFNGASLTATLPQVDGNNVGYQFLITNTNASALSVASSSSQLIYSSTGTASATTRSLAVGHSQIFTAIRTTATNAYGWSMV